jgi:hypothetical protein
MGSNRRHATLPATAVDCKPQAETTGAVDACAALAGKACRVPFPNQALGVLHASCGHCHSETGIASFLQLRFSTADATLPIEKTAP